MNCNEKGHLTKKCKKYHGVSATIKSLESLTTEHLESEQRTIIKVSVSDRLVSFFIDTGWLIKLMSLTYLYIHQSFILLIKVFFAQNVRIHLNILFRAAIRGKSKMLSIAEFRELLADM